MDDALRLAADLRPQAYASHGADRISEPVVEPHWSGLRVLVGVAGGRVVLQHEGEPVTDRPELAERAAAMLGALVEGAVFDGHVTRQIVSDAGVYTGPDAIESTGKLIARSLVGSGMPGKSRAEQLSDRMEQAAVARTFQPDEVVNLVLTDLLWLDGDSLLEVPLLERKRLLESIVPGDELVRAGPYVRPPIATWVGSWRAQGFDGLTFKEANSRYRPGETTREWTVTTMPRR